MGFRKGLRSALVDMGAALFMHGALLLVLLLGSKDRRR